MDTKHFDTHRAMKTYLRDNTEAANSTLLRCYEMIVDGEADALEPFKFNAGGRQITVEVSHDEIPHGLERLMEKAAWDEDYEIAADARDLLSRTSTDTDASAR